MNTVNIVDSDGNTYTRAVPVEGGEAFYSLDSNGDIIVVTRFKKAQMAPKFTLAPANPNEDEIAFKKALNKVKICCHCGIEFSGFGQFCERCDPL